MCLVLAGHEEDLEAIWHGQPERHCPARTRRSGRPRTVGPGRRGGRTAPRSRHSGGGRCRMPATDGCGACAALSGVRHGARAAAACKRDRARLFPAGNRIARDRHVYVVLEPRGRGRRGACSCGCPARAKTGTAGRRVLAVRCWRHQADRGSATVGTWSCHSDVDPFVEHTSSPTLRRRATVQSAWSQSGTCRRPPPAAASRRRRPC